jgi:hypothetical protein
MGRERWNNATRHRGPRAHKRSHAAHERKGASTFGNGVDGTPQSRDAAEGTFPMQTA